MATVQNRGTGTHNTGAATLVPGGRTATLAVGSIGVLAIALDNAGAGGASLIAPASWTDAKGNVWTRRENALYDNGAASAGIEMVFYTAPITTALLTSDAGTITWSGGSPVAKAWTWYEVIPAAGTTLEYSTGGTIAGATAANASVTTGTIAIGDVVIAGYFAEGVAAVTADSDTTNGSWTAQQTATIGSTTSGVRIATQAKAQTTAASTQTYNVTVASQDRIAGYIVIHEVPAGTTVAMAGSATGQSTTGAAVLRGRVPLIGLTDGDAAAEGTLVARVGLVGAAVGTSTTSGAVTTRIGLSGTAAGVSAGVGALSGGVALLGGATGATTTAGALRITARLTGSAVGSSTNPDAVLRGRVPMVGAAAGQSTASGAIAVRVRLSGSAAGSSTAAGALYTAGQVDLAGSAAGSSTATAVLSGRVPLDGEATGSSAGDSALTVTRARISMGGNAEGVSTTTAAMRLIARLLGQAIGDSTATGTLVTDAEPQIPGALVVSVRHRFGVSSSVTRGGQGDVTASGGAGSTVGGSGDVQVTVEHG